MSTCIPNIHVHAQKDFSLAVCLSQSPKRQIKFPFRLYSIPPILSLIVVWTYRTCSIIRPLFLHRGGGGHLTEFCTYAPSLRPQGQDKEAMQKQPHLQTGGGGGIVYHSVYIRLRYYCTLCSHRQPYKC